MVGHITRYPGLGLWSLGISNDRPDRDYVRDANAPTEDDILAKIDAGRFWARALSGLTPRQLDVFLQRYLRGDEDGPPSYKEIGQELGVTGERARQLYRRALVKIQDALDTHRMVPGRQRPVPQPDKPRKRRPRRTPTPYQKPSLVDATRVRLRATSALALDGVIIESKPPTKAIEIHREGLIHRFERKDDSVDMWGCATFWEVGEPAAGYQTEGMVGAWRE